MTAAAFAKGFLALEGELTPILVQMVKSGNHTNGLLDNADEAQPLQRQYVPSAGLSPCRFGGWPSLQGTCSQLSTLPGYLWAAITSGHLQPAFNPARVPVGGHHFKAPAASY